MKITKTNIIEFIIGIILYSILVYLIPIDFKSFLLGVVFPLIVIIIGCILKGLK